jgi:hypothetical protein
MHQHTIVSIDHHVARVFHLDALEALPEKLQESAVRETDNRHHADGKRPDHTHFYDDVAKVLGTAVEILIVGHGPAKDEFNHRLGSHHKDIAARVVGVESIDKPTDKQLIALAKKRFKAIDAWL